MGQRILFFESESSFGAQVKSYLERWGASVRVVADGSQGLEIAEANPPDLILLTIELVGVNGFLVCKRLKKIDELSEVPLIILSSEASADTFEQHKKLRTRADDYLHKPVSPQTLKARIEQLIPLSSVPTSGRPPSVAPSGWGTDSDSSAAVSVRPSAAPGGKGLFAATLHGVPAQALAQQGQTFRTEADFVARDDGAAQDAEIDAAVERFADDAIDSLMLDEEEGAGQAAQVSQVAQEAPMSSGVDYDYGAERGYPSEPRVMQGALDDGAEHRQAHYSEPVDGGYRDPSVARSESAEPGDGAHFAQTQAWERPSRQAADTDADELPAAPGLSPPPPAFFSPPPPAAQGAGPGGGSSARSSGRPARGPSSWPSAARASTAAGPAESGAAPAGSGWPLESSHPGGRSAESARPPGSDWPYDASPATPSRDSSGARAADSLEPTPRSGRPEFARSDEDSARTDSSLAWEGAHAIPESGRALLPGHLDEERSAVARMSHSLRGDGGSFANSEALKESQAEVQRLTQALEYVRSDAQSQLEAAEQGRRRAEQRLAALETAGATRSASNGGSSSASGVSSRDFLALREQLNRKDRELLNLRTEIAERDQQVLEANDRSLALERELADISDEVAAAQRGFDEQRAEVQALVHERDGLRQRETEAQGLLHTLQERNRELQQRCEWTEEKLAESQEQHRVQMQQAEQQQRAELEESQGQLAQTAEHLARTSDELQQYGRQLQELQARYDAECKQHERAADTVDALEQQLAELERERERLQVEAQELQAAQQEASEKHQHELAQQQQERDAEVSALRQELERAREEGSEAQQQLQVVEARLRDSESARNALAATLTRSQNETEQAREAESALKQELSELNSQLAHDAEVVERVRRAMAIGLGLLEQRPPSS